MVRKNRWLYIERVMDEEIKISNDQRQLISYTYGYNKDTNGQR